MPRQNKNIRGFSLVELGIVMAVIGVIIGGLWVLVGKTMDNVKQNELSRDITAVVDNVRSAYMNQPVMVGNAQTIMTKLKALQTVFPSDMTGGTGNMPSTPWSDASLSGALSTFNVCAWNPACTAPILCECDLSAGATLVTSPLFAIDIRQIPQADCIAAAVADSTSDMPEGLVDVWVNGKSVGPAAGGPLPVTPAKAEAGCTSATPNIIDFVYRLNVSTGQ